MSGLRHLLQLLLPLSLWGGTSANYTLDPDTFDAGGLRGTSASYTANFSAASGGYGASAAYILRTGFAGRLSDPAINGGLQITASPPTVNEGATRQLGAAVLYDDLTTTPLAAGSVAWSVQSGPVSGVSAGGLVTAAVVYQNTPAVVRGAYQSLTGTLTLTVLNTLPDNFGSYAGDSIPDDWQVLFFGIGNPVAGPLVDADSDGYNNLFEYNACLIPTDPLSVFSLRVTNAPGSGHAVTFSPRVSGCIYTLMGSSNLTQWAAVSGTITDVGAVRTILDPSGAGPRRFYYIVVQRL